MPEHTIAENLQRLIDAKTAIGSAITAKGGTVASGDGLEEFAADIGMIPSGSGDNNASFIDVIDNQLITIQNNLQRIDLSSFNINYMANQMFKDCAKLKECILPPNLYALPDDCFRRCLSLKNIIIPNFVKSMGNYVFSGCTSLTSVNIPTNVSLTTLPQAAFLQCSSLTELEIPENISIIYSLALYGLSGLQKLKFKRTSPPYLMDSQAIDVPTTCTIYVPTGYLSAYTQAPNYPSPSTYTYVEY